MLATSKRWLLMDTKTQKFGMSKAEIVKMKPCAMYKGSGAPKGAEAWSATT